jgi:hypothetical protein
MEAGSHSGIARLVQQSLGTGALFPSYVFVTVYIGIGAKAPDIPLYDDGQYRVVAQYRHALYIQSRIVSHWLEHIQLSYFTSNKLESKANKTR